MKAKALAIAISIGLSAPAQAEVLAGWDFSQYDGAGSLLTEGGGTPADTLDANYSTFDPTEGVGLEAADFGTLYFNGDFDSTDVDESAPSPIFAPAAGSLSSNLDAPAGCCQPFDSLQALLDDGQPFANALSMTATSAVDVVFEVDLSNVPEEVTNFGFSFAGQSVGGDAPVDIAWESESVASEGFLTLTSEDALIEVPLNTAASEFVRITLSLPTPGDGVGQVFLDNVAITGTVPEPGHAGAIAALLSVLGLRRRLRA